VGVASQTSAHWTPRKARCSGRFAWTNTPTARITGGPQIYEIECMYPSPLRKRKLVRAQSIPKRPAIRELSSNFELIARRSA
jgi:hypothetical protein